eukprot:CAMPEP_0178416226 /NCGR_PEP_ID=MMETSP0689_2-20121128/23955_1 /TAXON_ID=160604 /ORGANISM="Amphidinium massartii, Strain CS-259" /LENGTH=426 /DNA_ID=CAMNT_0020037565 /DNA_START=88 /DNA_END=1369 /DNA_ORIENTATION=+
MAKLSSAQQLHQLQRHGLSIRFCAAGSEGKAGCSPLAIAALPAPQERTLNSTTEAADGHAVATARSHRAALLQYWRLSKGKLTVWVALSALPGYFLALPAAVDASVLAALFTGTCLTSASAQAMNQVMEVKRDAKMSRTAQRPLPSGRLSQSEAVRFAVASGASGLSILTVGTTPLTAVVAGTTMATYIAMYTPLKVVSPYNTHVGAISGSLPTLLGFTAAVGSGIFASPWAGHAAWLFTMQTIWQMPHFYALAWLHRADYIRGGYTMFPLSDTTGRATAAMSKPYLVALCAMPWLASAMDLASWMLPVGAILPSALWFRSLRAFEAQPCASTCRRFFLDSLTYLLATLGLFTAFARATPERIEDEPSSGENSNEAKGVRETLGPAWRDALHAKFSELCPHEQVRQLFGLLRSSCPFSSSSGTSRE